MTSFVPSDSPKAPPSVFHLHDPAALFRKLAWELTQLSRSIAPDVPGPSFDSSPAYCAFNFAVTAWHMTDWVWQSASADQKRSISEELGFKLASDDEKNLGRFCDKLCERSGSLRICRQIANGSKHKTLRKSDPNVRVHAEFQKVVEPAGRFKVGGYYLNLAVSDESGEVSAQRIFLAVTRFWEDFLCNRGFMEGTRYVQGKPLTPEQQAELHRPESS